MSDLYLQALFQSLLGSPGSGSSEFQGLLAEVCRRFILSGVSVSSGGVFSLGSSIGPSSIANLGATGVIGDLINYDSTTTLARLAAVAAGKVLKSAGIGAAPAYGQILNADVDPAAAIAYTKLNLATSILNADINAAAAIAYSKLNLATSIVNADINAAAAIAYSKLNLATSILNADVNAAAAIAWSKLDKTGSSLADLTTKSAAALTSGIIPDARIPGFTSDASARIRQLAFDATQSASADANTLDDYEEGTWTPTLGGSSGQSGQVYTRQIGTYIKIGRLVVAAFRFTMSTLGTVTGNAQIQSLPFTIENTTNLLPGHGISFWTALTTSWVYITSVGVVNTTTATLFGATAAATGLTALVQADLSATSDIGGVIVYRATN